VTFVKTFALKPSFIYG